VRRDPPTVATPAAAVVLAGYAGDAEAVRAALHSDDPDVRERALGAAQRVGVRTVAVRVAALRDPSTGVRRRACRLEARLPRPSVRVEAALLACLGDDDPLVVAAAADALGEVGAANAVDGLAEVVRAHDDARCRESAVAALGAIGGDGGLDAVLVALHDKPAVRRRAVVALAGFDSPRAEAGLVRALEDRDWQVRQAAEALRDAGAAE
jgi:HEAT repeat protein